MSSLEISAFGHEKRDGDYHLHGDTGSGDREVANYELEKSPLNQELAP
jgi:hypothetical protein